MKSFYRCKGLQKNCHTVEALGCTGQFFHQYIEEKMQWWNTTHKEQMTDKNIELDHIKPGSLSKTQDEVIQLSHFTNIQPLLKRHNNEKKAKWSDQDEIYWNKNIYQNANYRAIYWPQACSAMTQVKLNRIL